MAAVRLTGSGLGCSDWPYCEAGQLIPEADFHAWVEFGNRIITGLVSIAVVLAVSGSTLRRPLVTKLTRWSLGLIVGVAAQLALGAITVIAHLSPPVVMGHFLLSMVLIWNAVVLEDLARPDSTTDSNEYLGYTQYFTQLPVLLVGFHVAGATILWMSAVRLTLATRTSHHEVR